MRLVWLTLAAVCAATRPLSTGCNGQDGCQSKDEVVVRFHDCKSSEIPLSKALGFFGDLFIETQTAMASTRQIGQVRVSAEIKARMHQSTFALWTLTASHFHSTISKKTIFTASVLTFDHFKNLSSPSDSVLAQNCRFSVEATDGSREGDGFIQWDLRRMTLPASTSSGSHELDDGETVRTSVAAPRTRTRVSKASNRED